MPEMFDPAAVKKRAEENPLANIGSQRQCTKDIFMLVEALEEAQGKLDALVKYVESREGSVCSDDCVHISCNIERERRRASAAALLRGTKEDE